MKKFLLIHAEALYVRLCAIYGDKFYKSYHDESFKKLWIQEWLDSLSSVDVCIIKEILDICRKTLDWPPSIAEFLTLCEKQSGIPSLNCAFDRAIDRNFSHPIILFSYEKTGSWSFTHDKEDTLKSKFKNSYEESLHEFRKNPDKCLEYYNKFKNSKLIKDSSFNETKNKECKIIIQEYTNWENKYAENMKRCKENVHPSWDQQKVHIQNKMFDEKLYDERKKYLINLSENEAIHLSRSDKYDRIRFIRVLEGARRADNNTSNTCARDEVKDARMKKYSASHRLDKYLSNQRIK